MKIIDNIKPFKAINCETSATRLLLLHEGVEYSEPMMLGLSQGFGFIYWKMSFMNLPFIGGRAKPYELTKVFCENTGFEVDERQTSSRNKAWLNVEQFIDMGVPVALQLDAYHLEHFYHSFHFAGHFVTVYGYDSTHAYVFDTGKVYKVSLENLEKARFERGSMAAKARSYTIRKSKVQIAPELIIPDAVRKIADGFLNPPLKCFGYLGIKKLADDIQNWLSCTDKPEKELYDQADLMENGGTGGAVFRNMFTAFLNESLTYLPSNPVLEQAVELYSQAAANWTATADLIKSAGRTNNHKYLDAASAVCFETAEIEKMAMECLLRIKSD